MTLKNLKWDDELKIKTSKRYKRLASQLIIEVCIGGISSAVGSSFLLEGVCVCVKSIWEGNMFAQGLYSGNYKFGELIFGGGDLYSGGAYIWNEVSVSTCGGPIHGEGGLYSGGAYIWNEVSVSTCGGPIHGGGLMFGGGLIFGMR